MLLRWADFWSRLRSVSGETEIRTQSDLAAALDLRNATITDAKKRDSVPLAWCILLMESKGLSPQWLATGDGKPFLPMAGTPSPATQAAINDQLRLNGAIKRQADEAKNGVNLVDIVEELERQLGDLKLDPKVRAKLTALAIEHCQLRGRVEPSIIEALISLATGDRPIPGSEAERSNIAPPLLSQIDINEVDTSTEDGVFELFVSFPPGCPYCGHRLPVDLREKAKSIICPNCGNSVPGEHFTDIIKLIRRLARKIYKERGGVKGNSVKSGTR